MYIYGRRSEVESRKLREGFLSSVLFFRSFFLFSSLFSIGFIFSSSTRTENEEKKKKEKRGKKQKRRWRRKKEELNTHSLHCLHYYTVRQSHIHKVHTQQYILINTNSRTCSFLSSHTSKKRTWRYLNTPPSPHFLGRKPLLTQNSPDKTVWNRHQPNFIFAPNFFFFQSPPLPKSPRQNDSKAPRSKLRFLAKKILDHSPPPKTI